MPDPGRSRKDSVDAPAVVNAMTVDVEDYFHVSAFERSVPRSSWDGLESRVVNNTHRLLDLFDHAHVRATFFVLGWVAERHPALVRRIANAGHEIGSHGFSIVSCTISPPRSFAIDLRRSREAIQGRRVCRFVGYRAPSFSITARSLWALDIIQRKASSTTRSAFRSGTTATACRQRHVISRDPDESRRTLGMPGIDGAGRGREPARCRRRLLPAAPVFMDPMGDCEAERPRAFRPQFFTSTREVDPGQLSFAGITSEQAAPLPQSGQDRGPFEAIACVVRFAPLGEVLGFHRQAQPPPTIGIG